MGAVSIWFNAHFLGTRPNSILKGWLSLKTDCEQLQKDWRPGMELAEDQVQQQKAIERENNVASQTNSEEMAGS